MRQRIRSHLTYANVMVTILAFIVLGGAAYAAFHLPRNSVRSRNIKNGQVKSADVKNGGITDADIATANKDGTAATPSLRTLGTGGREAVSGTDPRLSNARTPTGAAGGDLTGSYPNPHLVTISLSGNAGLNNSFDDCSGTPNQWTNLSPDIHNQVGFIRDPFGTVHLFGAARLCGPNPVSDTIFTLPAGARPTRDVLLSTMTVDQLGTASVTVDPDGHVIASSGIGPGGGSLSLDGLTFRCGPIGQDGCP